MLVLQKARAEPAGLAVTHALLRRLHADGIVYCHWKSNEHVAAGLAGRTDLDLLVDRRAAPRFERALGAEGFKPCTAAPGRGYPGIEDRVGIDPHTGRLVHLHVHYQLTLGEKYLKGYHLPWEGAVLTSRRFDPAGIYVSDPHVELILHLVRLALKFRARDLAWSALGRPYVRGGARVEFEWLAARVRGDRLREVATDLLGARAAGAVVAVWQHGPTLRRILALRRRARPVLRGYRGYSASGALLRRWRREVRATLRRGDGKRLLPRGVVIALVGPDGSGKSSLARELVQWLRWKLDARPLYFGSGDGPVSPPRRLLRAVAVLVRALRRRPPTDAPRARREAAAGPPRSLPGRVWHLVGALVLAAERHARLVRARRLRARGRIVVCDRFPQTQLPGQNDGPRLMGYLAARSPLLRWAARAELAAYQEADRTPPDVVVKLRVSPAVAARRKPELFAGHVERRAAAVAALTFPAGTRVIEVDADQPFERVLLDVKRAVWDEL